MELQERIAEILCDYDLDDYAEEYDFEAEIIANFIRNNQRVNEINSTMLADHIQLVFVTSLSIFPDISLCKGIALEIIEFMNKEAK